MSFQQTVKTMRPFAKIFKLNKEKKCANADDNSNEKTARRADDRKVAKLDDYAHTIEAAQLRRADLRFQRFKGSRHYHRRRNGITDKDYFEFLRLKIRRAQQQMIDTYVYGWK